MLSSSPHSAMHDFSAAMCGRTEGRKMRYLVAVFVSTVALLGTSANALESFTCTFGDNKKPCQQSKGDLCKRQLASNVHVTCGNLVDSFICMFTRAPFASVVDKKAAREPSALAVTMIDPGAGNLTLVYQKYDVSCDIK